MSSKVPINDDLARIFSNFLWKFGLYCYNEASDPFSGIIWSIPGQRSYSRPYLSVNREKHHVSEVPNIVNYSRFLMWNLVLLKCGSSSCCCVVVVVVRVVVAVVNKGELQFKWRKCEEVTHFPQYSRLFLVIDTTFSHLSVAHRRFISHIHKTSILTV